MGMWPVSSVISEICGRKVADTGVLSRERSDTPVAGWGFNRIWRELE